MGVSGIGPSGAAPTLVMKAEPREVTVPPAPAPAPAPALQIGQFVLEVALERH